MEKQKIKSKLVLTASVLLIIFFMGFSNASVCSELGKLDCKTNYKCVFDSQNFLIFEKGKCVDAKEYYSGKIEQNKIDNLKKSSEIGVTGFFIKIYGKITGKVPVENLLEERRFEEESNTKKTFYINAGSKLIAKIVKE